ncbi:LOW QUALITY PROTEIN: hypothetical protein HID58_079980, partial [Brassica napus]
DHIEKNSDFAKELEMETEKENKPKEFVIENKQKVVEYFCGRLSMEELKQRNQVFVHLSFSLCSKDLQWLGKDGVAHLLILRDVDIVMMAKMNHVNKLDLMIGDMKFQKRLDPVEKNYDLAKELEMENEKENKLKEFVIENKLDKKWWNIPVEGLSIEEIHTGWEKTVVVHLLTLRDVDIVMMAN